MKPKGTSCCSGRKVVVSSSTSSTMVTACWHWTFVSRRRWRRRCGSQGGGVVPSLIGQDILLFSSADHSLKKDGIFLPSAIYQSLKTFSKCFSQYWQCEGKFPSLMGQNLHRLDMFRNAKIISWRSPAVLSKWNTTAGIDSLNKSFTWHWSSWNRRHLRWSILHYDDQYCNTN